MGCRIFVVSFPSIGLTVDVAHHHWVAVEQSIAERRMLPSGLLGRNLLLVYRF